MDELIRARIALLKNNPFYGRLALLLEMREDNNLMYETAATDGEYFYYHKNFIKNKTIDELQAILLHELLHVALGHIWRRDDRIHHVWNIACDHAVNSIVESDGFSIPKDWVYDNKYSGMNAEQIYDKLKKNIKMIEMQCSMGGGTGTGDKKNNGAGDGKKGKGNQKCPCGGSHKYWEKARTSKTAKKIQARWEGAISETAKKLKGDVPAEFARMIKEMQPKENWRQILMNYLSESKSDFDFLRRDRRTLDMPFYFPDLRNQEELDNIVCVIDTSGSIGVDQLNRFISEIKSILKMFPNTKGWFINCDAEVHESCDLAKVKELTSFSGGGGTSHRPVFDEIEKKELRPKVAICFTDLYTDFPDRRPSYPVLWLVTPDGTNEAPFGRIIKLSGAI